MKALSRRSDVELLRIILLTMVVSIHVSGPYLSSHFISGAMNWQVANVLDGGSRVAVDCFVLITGYFLCTIRGRNPLRQVARILTPLAFYFPLYLALYWLDSGGNPLRPMLSAAYDLARNDGLFYHMWYIQVIVVVYLLSPYLNILIQTLSRAQLRNLIVTLLCVTSVLPSLVYMTGVAFYDLGLLNSRLVLFVTLYLAGAYIRVHFRSAKDASGLGSASPAPSDYCSFLLRRTSSLAGLFTAVEVLIIGLTFLYNSRYSPLIFFGRLRGLRLEYPFGGVSGAFYEFNSIFVVAGSLLLFLLFESIDLGRNHRANTYVNRIGRYTYGAYLGHVFWIQVITRFVDPAAYADGPFYPLAVVSVIVAVAACALVTEALRQRAASIPSTMRRP